MNLNKCYKAYLCKTKIGHSTVSAIDFLPIDFIKLTQYISICANKFGGGPNEKIEAQFAWSLGHATNNLGKFCLFVRACKSL